MIGKVKLDRLRPDDIQRVYRVARWEGTYPDGSSRAPLSEQTIEHIHRRIFAALRQAVQWQYIARNVAEAVIPPKPGGHERDPFTAEGVGAMLDAVEGTIDLQRAALFILATGLRRGELLGLRWCDVDLEGASIQIRNTLTKHMEFKAPKTRSKRPLALSEVAVGILPGHGKSPRSSGCRIAEREERLRAASTTRARNLYRIRVLELQSISRNAGRSLSGISALRCAGPSAASRPRGANLSHLRLAALLKTKRDPALAAMAVDACSSPSGGGR